MDLAAKYSYRVFWSADDGEYVAACIEIPSLSGLGATPEAAMLEAREAAVCGWLAHLTSEGTPPPSCHG
jgi:predicted RNase H-like HicB family nuclease